ncbi:MAG: hypothetical protein WBV25_05280 [Methylocella sp.]
MLLCRDLTAVSEEIMRRAIEELGTGDDDDVECRGPGHKATFAGLLGVMVSS